jgi:uncharacterized membrane protein
VADEIAPLDRTAKSVAAAFLVSGVVHVLRPRTFEVGMPAWVPEHRRVIVWSGVAELACAAGLMWPRTRRLAGPASAALLAAVYPANVQMALDASRTSNRALKALTFGRLPLQFPMIRATWRAGRTRASSV